MVKKGGWNAVDLAGARSGCNVDVSRAREAYRARMRSPNRGFRSAPRKANVCPFIEDPDVAFPSTAARLRDGQRLAVLRDFFLIDCDLSVSVLRSHDRVWIGLLV